MGRAQCPTRGTPTPSPMPPARPGPARACRVCTAGQLPRCYAKPTLGPHWACALQTTARYEINWQPVGDDPGGKADSKVDLCDYGREPNRDAMCDKRPVGSWVLLQKK